MAFPLKVWVAAVVLGCATIAVAQLPPRAQLRRTGPVARELPEWAALRRAKSHLTRSAENLMLLQLRDSLLAELAPQPIAGADLRFLFPPDHPEESHVIWRRWVEPSWRSITPRDSSIAVAVAVVIDTLPNPEGLPRRSVSSVRLHHILPAATDGRTCLVVLSVGVRVARQLQRGVPITPRTLRERFGLLEQPIGILGPCGFYAAFGKPGTAIREWLESSDYQLVSHPVWPSTPALVDAPQRNSQWNVGRWWRSGMRYGRSELEAVSCATRNLDACYAAVFVNYVDTDWDLPEAYRSRSTLRGVAGTRSYSWAPWMWARHPLGPSARLFMSDAVVDLGRDRFRRFWRSEAPVDSAFQQAMDLPIEEWTLRWVRARVGVADAGPRVGFGSGFVAILVAGAFVAAGAAYYTRRTVW